MVCAMSLLRPCDDTLSSDRCFSGSCPSTNQPRLSISTHHCEYVYLHVPAARPVAVRVGVHKGFLDRRGRHSKDFGVDLLLYNSCLMHTYNKTCLQSIL